ncbi:MAG TPA: hypothetical protein VKR82_03665 [Candidatus Acidoferrales bacterium]|nr:hypothetical protein [Candidatus Acidoferrales bacterium]
MYAMGTNHFPAVYTAWFGRQIVLLVAIHDQQVPMPCRIVSESATDVRVSLKPGWEVDFPKEMILAVVEEGFALDPHWN